MFLSMTFPCVCKMTVIQKNKIRRIVAMLCQLYLCKCMTSKAYCSRPFRPIVYLLNHVAFFNMLFCIGPLPLTMVQLLLPQPTLFLFEKPLPEPDVKVNYPPSVALKYCRRLERHGFDTDKMNLSESLRKKLKQPRQIAPHVHNLALPGSRIESAPTSDDEALYST